MIYQSALVKDAWYVITGDIYYPGDGIGETSDGGDNGGNDDNNNDDVSSESV